MSAPNLTAINQSSYAAWLTVEKSMIGAGHKKIWNSANREDIMQETRLIFCDRYQGYLAEPDLHTFNFSAKHVKQLANSCLADAIRDFVGKPIMTGNGKASQKAEKALGIKRDESEYEHITHCDTDALAEIVAPCRFGKSASEQAVAERSDGILDFAKGQSDQRFAKICELLMAGFHQNEIAEILEMGISTVCELIAKNRDLLLAQMQLAKGGC